jgi:hypothetical protein
VLNSGFTKDEFMQCYSGKTVWKNWFFEIAPIPNKHASQDNISSGADQFSIDIIEIPLNFDR